MSWRHVLPGAAGAGVPFGAGAPGGRGSVQFTLGPGRVGQNAVEVVVLGPDGGPLTVPIAGAGIARVTVRGSEPEQASAGRTVWIKN
ncbi:hypothetical protein [Streptomyces sp. NPDC056160]|uniref:hypothetical protein n=1 Tax=Streptomyces sp. NPDC056160 TaxID=3345731 RepID=UPI0035DB23C1